MQAAIQFRGSSDFLHDGVGPLPCEIRGKDAADGSQLLVRVAVASPADVPAQLQNAEISLGDSASPDGGHGAALFAGGQRFVLTAAPIVHRDAQALIDSVIKPRAVRWRVRVFWRLVFALMHSNPGRSLLMRFYRR